VRGEHDDRDRRRLRVGLQSLRDFPAVDFRDGHVHQDEVRPRLRHHLQRLGAILGGDHAEPGELEDDRVDLEVVVVVLDEEYGRRRRGFCHREFILLAPAGGREMP
jgi:hypothetical protein